MSLSSRRTSRGLATPLAFLAAGALLVGCTSNEPAAGDSDSGGEARAASDNDDTGDTVVIGFSGPAADGARGATSAQPPDLVSAGEALLQQDGGDDDHASGHRLGRAGQVV